jgi:hypothetical protein
MGWGNMTDDCDAIKMARPERAGVEAVKGLPVEQRPAALAKVASKRISPRRSSNGNVSALEHVACGGQR